MKKLASAISSRRFSNFTNGRRGLAFASVTAALLVSSCGGGAASAPPPITSPQPSTPTPPVEPAAPAASSVPSAVPSAPATESAPSPTAEAKPAAPEPKGSSAESSEPLVLASEVLTAPKVAFLIDYPNSEAKEKAEAACAKDPKAEDPAVKSACLQKARGQFRADVLLFHKDSKDHITLTIYRRNESALAEVFVAPVAFANVTAHSVQLKFKGGGSGQRPIFKSVASPTLSLPNDYSIEIDDAEYGKLRYDAKVGFVDK